MFENPITFALLVSSVVSLAYYLLNREKDKKNRDSNVNMKYVLIFGIVFILGLKHSNSSMVVMLSRRRSA